MQGAVPRSRDVSVLGRVSAEFAEILTEEALDFIANLHRHFEPRRQDLLARRAARQKEFDRGALPDFLSDTLEIREREWQVAPQPKDLLDRRVELTGPTDRKMVINALNSGASTFMADFEDANCPTWHNMVEGQINLRDAVRRTISFEQSGKRYRLQDSTAVLSCRRYRLPLCSKLMVRRTASRRLICPSTMLCQVGQFASSKSAMKVEAPEFSALITILRSVGPVSSTRRSSRSFGCGATRHSRSLISRVSERKSGSAPRSNSFCRAARRASKSWRRGSKCRCRFAMKSSASSVRISANSALTRPSTLTSRERGTAPCIAAFYVMKCGAAT